ncbi:MAG: hypothetical protein WD250_07190 [Egibacteraceae bacterium]
MARWLYPDAAPGVKEAAAQIVAVQRLIEDSWDSVLVAARLATDDGAREGLDDVLAALGLDRAELEAELKEDIEFGQA